MLTGNGMMGTTATGRNERIFGSYMHPWRRVQRRKPKAYLEHRILVPTTELISTEPKNTNDGDHQLLHFSVLPFK